MELDSVYYTTLPKKKLFTPYEKFLISIKVEQKQVFTPL